MADFERFSVTNNRRGGRAIFTRDGMMRVAPGETRELFLTSVVAEDERKIEGIEVSGKAASASAPDPLDHDGDGRKGGSPKGEESTRARGAAKKKG